jgi:predicted XRE-type DNA-binding protein
MAGNPRLTQSRIAAREGISRARVTQVMNLPCLPVEIQSDLLSPPAPLEIHAFSERSLRGLVSYKDEKIQSCHWGELVQKLKSSAGH